MNHADLDKALDLFLFKPADRDSHREVIHAMFEQENQRSLPQNNAIHLWFDQVASEAQEKGLTVDVLLLKPSEFPITAGIIKDFFREIGRIMYKKDSTAKLSKVELTEIVKVCEKAFAERLDNTIPFPSEEFK